MRLLIILFLSFCFGFSIEIKAQLFVPTEVSPMPVRVSNNALTEGFVSGVPYVYSFAGIDSTKQSSGIHLKSYRYNTQTDIWESIADLPDPMGGKIAAGASYHDGIIYIIGGYHVMPNGSEISSAKVHRYAVETNSYLSDGMDIPVAIDDHVQAVWNDSLIYIITGWSNTNNVPNVQIYNPTEDLWLTGTPTPNNTDYKAFGASGLIDGNTIYYFGGARDGSNFPRSNRLRIGQIDPADPTQISWSVQGVSSTYAYRAAATMSMDHLHWIGGSSVTYNYNGIAYNGSGAVPPNNQNLFLDKENLENDKSTLYSYPMDLRGIANMSNTIKYIAGGMEANQSVTNKTYRLDWEMIPPVSVDSKLELTDFILAPNPANDFILLSWSNDLIQQVDAQILDVHGRTIQTSIIQSGEKIEVSNLAKGVYFLKLTNQKSSITQPIIIL